MLLLGTFIFVLLHSIQMPIVGGLERDREGSVELTTMSRTRRAAIAMSQEIQSYWTFNEWRDAETNELWDGDASKKKYSHSGIILEATNGNRYVLERWNGHIWIGTRSVQAYETGPRKSLQRGPLPMGNLIHVFMTVTEIVNEIMRRADES